MTRKAVHETEVRHLGMQAHARRCDRTRSSHNNQPRRARASPPRKRACAPRAPATATTRKLRTPARVARHRDPRAGRQTRDKARPLGPDPEPGRIDQQRKRLQLRPAGDDIDRTPARENREIHPGKLRDRARPGPGRIDKMTAADSRAIGKPRRDDAPVPNLQLRSLRRARIGRPDCAPCARRPSTTDNRQTNLHPVSRASPPQDPPFRAKGSARPAAAGVKQRHLGAVLCLNGVRLAQRPHARLTLPETSTPPR